MVLVLGSCQEPVQGEDMSLTTRVGGRPARAWSGRVVAGCLAFVLLASGLVMPTAASADTAPWAGSVTVTSSRADVDVHDARTTLTAVTSQPLAGDVYLSVYDDLGNRVGWCGSGGSGSGGSCATTSSGTTLTATVSVETNKTRTYTAYVAQDGLNSRPTTDVRATSNPVSVHNIGWVGEAALSVSRTEVDVHDTRATVTATSSRPLAGPYYLSLHDDLGNRIAFCGSNSWNDFGGTCTRTSSGTTLTATVSVETNKTRTYTAYVAQDGLNARPTTDVRATSNTVQVRNLGWNGSVVISRRTDSNGHATLTAETSPNVAGPYYLSLHDDLGNRIAFCGSNSWNDFGGTCTRTSSGTALTATVAVNTSLPRTYTAYVAQDGYNARPVQDVRAISGRLSTAGNGPTGAGETHGGFNPSEACSQRCHGDPVNSVTGEFWESNTDLSLPGTGVPLSVQRSFSTYRRQVAGAFGYGWTSDVSMSLTLAPGATGSSLADASHVQVVQENGSTVEFSRKSTGSYVAPARVLATLVRQGDGAFLLTRGTAKRFRFTSGGVLVRAEDRNGQGVTYEHNSLGQATAIRHDKGHRFELTWQGGRITSVSDGAGRTVTYAYSPAGDLTKVTLPGGGVHTYAYDAEHRVVALSQPGTGVTRNVYDTASRVVRQTDPLGRLLRFAYEPDQTTITAPDGTVTIERHLDGQVWSETKASGTAVEATTYFSYDITNNVSAVTDPLGRTTRFTYDARGNRTSVTDPLGRVTSTTYDALDNPLVLTNPAGERTTLAYDAQGNLVSTTAADGAVTTFGVNPDGTVASVTDALDRTTALTHTTHGLVAATTAPGGAKVTSRYDARGNRVSLTSPLGNQPGAAAAAHTSTFSYDQQGRPLTLTDPGRSPRPSTTRRDGSRPPPTPPASRRRSRTTRPGSSSPPRTPPGGPPPSGTTPRAGSPGSPTPPE
jgi:YD repeat-containing protein